MSIRSRVRTWQGWRGAALCLVACASVVAATLGPVEQRSAPGTRTFEVTYVASIDAIPEGAKRLQLWMPSPQRDAHQEIDRLDVDAPYPTTFTRDPEFGNSMLHLSISEPDRRAFNVSLRFRATRHEHVNRAGDSSGENDRPVPPPPHLRSNPQGL